MFDAGSLDIDGALIGRRAWALVWMALCSAALVLLRAFDPSGTALLPPCPFHALTGLYCPGCGSLRALHQALQGNMGAALGLNPLSVIAAPVIVYHLVSRVPGGFLQHHFASPLDHRYAARIVLTAVVSFWVLRNVPHYPFGVLAP